MTKTSGLAITSLILGIVGIMGLLVLPFGVFLIGIPAIIFGIVALLQIKKNAEFTGKGLAIAGLVMGIISTLLSIISVIVIVFLLMSGNLF